MLQASEQGLVEVAKLDLNLGNFYDFLGPFMPPIVRLDPTNFTSFNPGPFPGEGPRATDPAQRLSVLACKPQKCTAQPHTTGKIMALAALGQVCPAWVEVLKLVCTHTVSA